MRLVTSTAREGVKDGRTRRTGSKGDMVVIWTADCERGRNYYMPNDGFTKDFPPDGRI